MKIKKFNSAGYEKWSSFYNEVKYEIDQVAKSPKISPQDILAGYNDTLKEKYKILKNSDDISEELVSSKEFKIKKLGKCLEFFSLNEKFLNFSCNLFNSKSGIIDCWTTNGEVLLILSISILVKSWEFLYV